MDAVTKRKVGRPTKITAIAPQCALDKRVACIIEQFHLARVHTAEAARRMLIAGFHLHAAKEQVPHGEFLDWVETMFPFGRRWGQLCMQAAERMLDRVRGLEEIQTTVGEAIAPEVDPRRMDALIETMVGMAGNPTASQLLVGLGLREKPVKQIEGGEQKRVLTIEERTENLRVRTYKTWVCEWAKGMANSNRRQEWKVLKTDDIHALAITLNSIAGDMIGYLKQHGVKL